jgi:hypothetical protein
VLHSFSVFFFSNKSLIFVKTAVFLTLPLQEAGNLAVLREESRKVEEDFLVLSFASDTPEEEPRLEEKFSVSPTRENPIFKKK